jgi:hypothetical protein
MTTKQEILDELRRISIQLGLTPGKRLFETESGIKEGQWYGVYWSKWNDLVIEAGLATNQKKEKLPRDFVLEKYAIAVRKFGRIPTAADLRIYSKDVESFPDEKTRSRHFGSKSGLLEAFSIWVKEREDYHDLLGFLPEVESSKPAPTEEVKEGMVYLLRSGDHFKIGRSDQLEQRVKKITVALPEKLILEHAIRTDDPSGIEAYWHRRFAEKRANGEWFRLSRADIMAFKRRKFQ